MILATCKLIIQDEVNCKFTNLDLDTRKALVKKFKYEDPTARFRPSYKLGRWDGAVSFFGLGGTTYLSMLGQVLQYLEERNYYIEIEDLRTSPMLEFPEVAEEFWGDLCWPVGHMMAGQPIRMRDYQCDVVNNFLKNPQCLQEVATGAGKTEMGMELIRLALAKDKRIIFVCNRIELVLQTSRRLWKSNGHYGFYPI